jgi:hypothetical protein
MVFSTTGFPRVFPNKRLELKSLKGQTKAEELGPRWPEPSTFVCPLKLFNSSRFSGKHTENGGIEGAPRGTDPLLKNIYTIASIKNTISYKLVYIYRGLRI